MCYYIISDQKNKTKLLTTDLRTFSTFQNKFEDNREHYLPLRYARREKYL